MRYVLLDRITHIEPGRGARGLKCVTLTDEVVHDHFPSMPLYPGALWIETAAHLGGFLLDVSLQQPGQPVQRAILAQVERALFHRPAVPGDRIELAGSMGAATPAGTAVAIHGHIDGQLAFECTLHFKMRPVPSEPIHAQRRELYRLWTQHLPNPPTIP